MQLSEAQRSLFLPYNGFLNRINYSIPRCGVALWRARLIIQPLPSLLQSVLCDACERCAREAVRLCQDAIQRGLISKLRRFLRLLLLLLPMKALYILWNIYDKHAPFKSHLDPLGKICIFFTLFWIYIYGQISQSGLISHHCKRKCHVLK